MSDQRDEPTGSVVTIGVFDGVHKGHQSILARVVAEATARRLRPTVVTFDPHPARVLAPDVAPALLDSLERRKERLRACGITQIRVISFTEQTAQESARSFVERVLVSDLGARVVVVGTDFRFGRGREGDVTALREWGLEWGFDVESVPLAGDSDRFSSTVARTSIENGDLAGARSVLGHYFSLIAEVVHGDARGATELGFPTANLGAEPTIVRPALGVYAGAARIFSGEWYPAAISVGRRPQFYESGDVLVEAHLVDFDGDLYGTTLEVVFLERLRDELTFTTTDDLITQMGIDVGETRDIFNRFEREFMPVLNP